MPGPKTYQAIGFATYQGGRFLGKSKRADLERKMHRRKRVRSAAIAGGALVAAAIVAASVSRAGRTPTV